MMLIVTVEGFPLPSAHVWLTVLKPIWKAQRLPLLVLKPCLGVQLGTAPFNKCFAMLRV